MSDHAPDTKNTPTDIPQSDAVDQSRRKLAGAALGAGAVFTLASRPVWANQCTISGMASGNLSTPGGAPCQGCTPGYWGRCQHFSAWSQAGYSTTQTFNDVFGVTEYTDCSGVAYTLLDVLFLQGGLKTCGSTNEDKNNEPANPAGAPACTSGNAFGNLGGDPVSTNLGFHAVAALLNAGHNSVNYGYEPGDIITMFKNNYLTNGAALKDTFDMLNNRGCPLGSDTDNRNRS